MAYSQGHFRPRCRKLKQGKIRKRCKNICQDFVFLRNKSLNEEIFVEKGAVPGRILDDVDDQYLP